MGIVKRHIESEESKRAIAVGLLLKAGVLANCERHEDIIFQAGGSDNMVEAYKLANATWADHSTAFKDRREMTDIMLAESKNGDYANDGCENCRAQMDKD